MKIYWLKGSDFMGAGILCICIGLIILCFCFKPFQIKNAMYGKGEVCAREYHYEPGDEINSYYHTIRYFAKGVEYYSKCKFRQGYIKDGKKILLKYSKDNPKEVIIIPKGIIFGAFVFIIFGIYIILSTLGIIPPFMG